MNDIFTNPDDVQDNIDGSLENLGHNPENFKQKQRLTANNKCKFCWGKGFVKMDFPGKIKLQTYYCKCVKVIND